MSKPDTGSPLSPEERELHRRLIALHRDEPKFVFQLKSEMQSALTHGALRALFKQELESPIAASLEEFQSDVLQVAKGVLGKDDLPDDAKLDDEYRKKILNMLQRARIPEEIGA